MKIAILSDSHDYVEEFKKALSQVQDTDAMIFCGDLVAPSMLKLLCQKYRKPIHLTFGNCDGDEYLMVELTKAEENQHAKFYKPFGELELGGKKIVFVHYPPLALGLASSEKYDAVFYGHDHEKHEEKVGKTLLVNPGTVGKMLKEEATYAIYDPDSNSIEFKEVK